MSYVTASHVHLVLSNAHVVNGGLFDGMLDSLSALS